jgi:solute carrier family 13 (sodium-dependent dicarboxylate transporter), member 2/3/5
MASHATLKGQPQISQMRRISMCGIRDRGEFGMMPPVKYLLRVLSGPVAFVVLQFVPIAALRPEGHFALSTFAWILAWWVLQPVPWAITGLLPLVLLPIAGVLPFQDVATVYGQRILFFLVGVMLFGHALEKHGLGRRIAIKILSVRGVATSGNRLILVIMIVSAVVSAMVDDSATVAMMIPIAMSVGKFARDSYSKAFGKDDGAPRFMEAMALAVLYGSAAGGIMTPAGVPFNPLSISLLDQLTGYKIDFVQWTTTGVIIGAATIPLYFLVLRFLSASEIQSIPDGSKYFQQEEKLLGPMSRGEKNIVFVLAVMIVLWVLPALVAIRGLDIWIVPAIAALLLYILPINVRTREMTLSSKDFQNGIAWNVVFLVTSGAALAAIMTRLGLIDVFGSMVKSRVSAAALPWFAGAMTNLVSHFSSGGVAATSMICTILFPLANQLGVNPAVIARIIPGSALAVCFPWAGAAAAAAFASGAITFRNMFKIGIVATILVTVATIVLSMITVPGLNAFTAP